MTAGVPARSSAGFQRLARPTRLFASLFLLAIFIFGQGLAVPVMAQADQSARPTLVIMMVADQFSYNFLTRYEDKLTSGGLRYLVERGAEFSNCRLECAVSDASVGHTVIATGANPWHTGVIANKWYDRRSRSEVGPTEDKNASMVGANGPAGSVKLMYGTTLGDQLKLATNGRSKVFSMAVSEPASLLLAGRLASNAFWFDTKSGNMVSSSRYGTTQPAWVQAFNDQHPADRYIGKPWQRLMPETEYAASTRDDYPRERPLENDGRAFPHVINRGSGAQGQDYYGSFAMTPMANQLIFDFARDAVDKERLGTHTTPDLLILGLSAGEQLAQYFGPYSQEVEDLVLRMDRSMESFFQFVDEKVGLDKCLLVFTASHGGPAIPEFLSERGLDAGRIDPAVFTQFLDAKLDSRVGEENWIESFCPPNLYLNLDAIDNQKLRQPDVETLVKQLAQSVPGVGEIVTAYQLFTNQIPNGPFVQAVRKSYDFGRSGELFVIPKSGWVFTSQTSGTGYGSPYSYDTQVPLIFCGPGVAHGNFIDRVSPCDIAATVAALLGVEMPSLCEGQGLNQIMLQEAGPPRPRMKSAPAAVPQPDQNRKR